MVVSNKEKVRNRADQLSVKKLNKLSEEMWKADVRYLPLGMRDEGFSAIQSLFSLILVANQDDGEA